MALTAANTPANIVGTGRPVIVRLSTNNWVTATGTAFARTLTATSGATVGQTLVFTLGNGTVVTMTAATTPDSTGAQFSASTTTGSTLAADFQKNYWLNLWFVITSSGATVTFTARQVGTAYGITFTGTWSGYTLGTLTAGADKVVRSNFTCLLDVWLETVLNSGNFGSEPIAKLAQTPDSIGYFTFDIGAVLDAYMKDVVPAYASTSIVIATGALLRYRVFVAESFNVPAVIQAVGQIGTNFHAIRARLPQATNVNNANSIPEGILTGRNATKKVTTEQREWLTVLSPQGGAWTTNIVVTFTDGTSVSMASPPTPPALSGPGVFHFPVGYTQRNIASVLTGGNAGKTVAKYVVMVSFTSSGLEPAFTFEVVDKCPPFTRYFLFRNQLGGWETLRCGGITTKTLTTEREVATQVIPANYTMQDAEMWNHEVAGQDEYETSTGYVFRNQADAEYYARELHLSEAVFWDNNGRWEPVYLTSNDVRLNRDRQKMWSVGFRFRQGYTYADKSSNLWNLG